MKNNIFEIIKELSSWVSTWVFVGGIWGGLMNLYSFTKTGVFKWSFFFISVWVWGFVWYLAGEFTTNWTIIWLSWALGMKIFDLVSDKWIYFIACLLKNKYNINIIKDEKNNKDNNPS